MSIKIKGKVWKFGDNMNTDFMAPSFSKMLPWEELKKTILHVHHDFTENFKEGDVIVAANNFGCGSSRELAPANLKKLGVGCVVAESFGRIFFRNSIAIAFPVLVCPGVSAAFKEGEDLELDFENSTVRNLSQGTELKGAALPADLVNIVNSGGILEVLKQEVAAAG
jgi:3-isopropylmalate/(R)-2-methylmalate dehydratase small subunit